jgi:hypothetical protein
MNNKQHRFIPDTFSPPEVCGFPEFTIRVLTVHDLIKDYDAVMTSVDHLQGLFGSENPWPTKDLSLVQNLIDIGWHQKEFQRRTSFTYTVVSLDESICLGCIYIYPLDTEAYSAEVYYWVRKAAYDSGLEPILFSRIQEWLNESWPFQKVVFPFR